jgi:hypothetical protein
MAQTPELTELDKAYSSARPRKEIAPEDLLGLLGRAVNKAADEETPEEEARDVARRALALAESISGDVAKGEDDPDYSAVEVDAEILADVEKDADGADFGSQSLSGMLTELRKRLGVEEPPAEGAEGDKAEDVNKGAEDAKAADKGEPDIEDVEFYSADLNEDPSYKGDPSKAADADADD